jgi:hypothetical protein
MAGAERNGGAQKMKVQTMHCKTKKDIKCKLLQLTFIEIQNEEA